MEILVRLRCCQPGCGRTTTVRYEAPLGEPFLAEYVMAKVARESRGWKLNTIVSRLDGSVLAHDLCDQCSSAAIPEAGVGANP